MANEYHVSWSGLEITGNWPASVRTSWIAVEVVHPGRAVLRTSNLAIEALYQFSPISLVNFSWVGIEVLWGYYRVLDAGADVFNPPVPPTIESQVTFTAVALEAAIASSWSSSSPSGLNAVSGLYSLVWAVLMPDQLVEIEHFLEVHRGLIPFLYTIPSESTQKLFKCKTWNVTYLGGSFSLKTEFRQVFDVVTYGPAPVLPDRGKVTWLGAEILRSIT